MTTALTKRIVVQRQLVAAVRLLYEGADSVVVYSLAANAWEIVDFLATRNGVDSLSNQTRQNVSSGKDLKIDYINSPYRNFFKHADRDPDATIPPLQDGNVVSLVYLAVEDYMRLYGASPIEFQVYQLWYLAKNEEKVASIEMEHVLGSTREIFPGIRGVARDEQLSMARAVLLAARRDQELLNDPRTEENL